MKEEEIIMDNTDTSTTKQMEKNNYKKLFYLFRFKHRRRDKSDKVCKKAAVSVSNGKKKQSSPDKRRDQLDRDMRTNWEELPTTLRRRKEKLSQDVLAEFHSDEQEASEKTCLSPESQQASPSTTPTPPPAADNSYISFKDKTPEETSPEPNYSTVYLKDNNKPVINDSVEGDPHVDTSVSVERGSPDGSGCSKHVEVPRSQPPADSKTPNYYEVLEPLYCETSDSPPNAMEDPPESSPSKDVNGVALDNRDIKKLDKNYYYQKPADNCRDFESVRKKCDEINNNSDNKESKPETDNAETVVRDGKVLKRNNSFLYQEMSRRKQSQTENETDNINNKSKTLNPDELSLKELQKLKEDLREVLNSSDDVSTLRREEQHVIRLLSRAVSEDSLLIISTASESTGSSTSSVCCDEATHNDSGTDINNPSSSSSCTDETPGVVVAPTFQTPVQVHNESSANTDTNSAIAYNPTPPLPSTSDNDKLNTTAKCSELPNELPGRTKQNGVDSGIETDAFSCTSYNSYNKNDGTVVAATPAIVVPLGDQCFYELVEPLVIPRVGYHGRKFDKSVNRDSNHVSNRKAEEDAMSYYDAVALDGQDADTIDFDNGVKFACNMRSRSPVKDNLEEQQNRNSVSKNREAAESDTTGNDAESSSKIVNKKGMQANGINVDKVTVEKYGFAMKEFSREIKKDRRNVDTTHGVDNIDVDDLHMNSETVKTYSNVELGKAIEEELNNTLFPDPAANEDLTPRRHDTYSFRTDHIQLFADTTQQPRWKKALTIETLNKKPKMMATIVEESTTPGETEDEISCNKLSVRDILKKFEELGGRILPQCDDSEKSATLREIQETLRCLEEKVRDYETSMTSSHQEEPESKLQQKSAPRLTSDSFGHGISAKSTPVIDNWTGRVQQHQPPPQQSHHILQQHPTASQPPNVTTSSQHSEGQEPVGQHDGKHSLLQFAMLHFRQSPEFEMLKTADGSITGSLKVIESLKSKKNKGKKGNKENDWTWKEQVALVKFSPTPIEQSLLRLETSELNELAVECFISVMRYMSDLPMAPEVTEVKCVYTILMHCHKHESLRDEVYCQLMKQTTNNKSTKPDSCQRGWRLFSIVAAYFICTDTLKPYLFKYLETAAYDKRRAYHGTATVCLQNLRKTFKYGGRKNVPSVEEITAISAGRNSKRQIYRLPGGTERVINTKSTTVVQDVIEEMCAVINIQSGHEMEEFSLYCIVEGDTFTMPLAREEYILDVTTELHKNQQVFYLIFCRSVWHFPLRLDSQLYIEVVFNQIAPDYLEGLLLVMPGEQLEQDVIYDIAKMAALLHRAADMQHLPTMKETKFLLPKPALTVRDVKPAQWVNMVQSNWREVEGLQTIQSKAQVLEILSKWPLFGSSFFAVKRVSDPKERSDHILALNRHGVHFIDLVTHETLIHYPFSEVISTRKVKSEDGTLFLDMKCGNLMQQRITRLQTDQAHEISRLIRQYITMEQRVRS